MSHSVYERSKGAGCAGVVLFSLFALVSFFVLHSIGWAVFSLIMAVIFAIMYFTMGPHPGDVGGGWWHSETDT